MLKKPWVLLYFLGTLDFGELFQYQTKWKITIVNRSWCPTHWLAEILRVWPPSNHIPYMGMSPSIWDPEALKEHPIFSGLWISILYIYVCVHMVFVSNYMHACMYVRTYMYVCINPYVLLRRIPLWPTMCLQLSNWRNGWTYGVLRFDPMYVCMYICMHGLNAK